VRRAVASAPGKLFLGGEYAVLEGGPAVVTTLERRVVAEVGDVVAPPSPVLDAVRGNFAKLERGTDEDVPGVRANSGDLSRGPSKLGLGSSAAVAAAATGAFFEWAGLPIESNRDKVLEMASRAHRAAQGGRGSGADVVASVLGGTILFSRCAEPARVEKSAATHVIVWSGAPASTVDLVGAVERFAGTDPSSFGILMSEMRELASRIADLFEEGIAAGLPGLYDDYGELMKRLGEAAGVEIVTAAHRRIRKLARDLGGGAKPSGAGGGDCAIAAFDDPDAAKRFSDACRSEGLLIIDARIHAAPLRKG